MRYANVYWMKHGEESKFGEVEKKQIVLPYDRSLLTFDMSWIVRNVIGYKHCVISESSVVKIGEESYAFDAVPVTNCEADSYDVRNRNGSFTTSVFFDNQDGWFEETIAILVEVFYKDEGSLDLSLCDGVVCVEFDGIIYDLEHFRNFNRWDEATHYDLYMTILICNVMDFHFSNSFTPFCIINQYTESIKISDIDWFMKIDGLRLIRKAPSYDRGELYVIVKCDEDEAFGCVDSLLSYGYIFAFNYCNDFDSNGRPAQSIYFNTFKSDRSGGYLYNKGGDWLRVSDGVTGNFSQYSSPMQRQSLYGILAEEGECESDYDFGDDDFGD